MDGNSLARTVDIVDGPECLGEAAIAASHCPECHHRDHLQDIMLMLMLMLRRRHASVHVGSDSFRVLCIVLCEFLGVVDDCMRGLQCEEGKKIVVVSGELWNVAHPSVGGRVGGRGRQRSKRRQDMRRRNGTWSVPVPSLINIPPSLDLNHLRHHQHQHRQHHRRHRHHHLLRGLLA